MMNVNKILIFFGSLLYPIYFIPTLFQYLAKNEKFSYFMIAFLMAVLAYLMVPYDTMDIVRHYEIINSMAIIDFNDIILEQRLVDYFFNVYSWIVINLGLKKEFIPFSVTFISYYLYFMALKILIDNEFKRHNKFNLSLKFITFLGFFLLFNEIRFMDAASGLRNIFSFSIFSFGLISFIYNKNYIRFYILVILSVGIHFSAFISLLLFLLSHIVRENIFYRILFLVCYILFLFGLTESIFYFFIDMLEPFLKNNGLYFPSYFDKEGAWGAGYYLTQNIKSLIFEKYVKLLPLYVAGLYFIIFKNFSGRSLYKYLVTLFIFISLVSVSRTILDRFNWFFVILFIYFLLVELINKGASKLKKIYIAIFSVSLLIMDLGSIYKYRDIFWRSWGDLIYTPLIFKVDNSVKPSEYIIRNAGE